MKRKKWKGRILSMLLAVCMLLGTLPAELLGGVAGVKAEGTKYTFNPTELVSSGVLTQTTLSGTVETGTDNKFQLLNTDSAAKIESCNITVDGVNYTSRYAFGGKSAAEGRRIRFETQGSANVTVCAYTGTAGRALYLDKDENIWTIDTKSTGEIHTFSVEAGTHDFYVKEAIYIVYIEVEEVDVSTYNITVTDGAATNALGETITEAAAKEEVTITANAPAAGQVFSGWTAADSEGNAIDASAFADASQAATTFTMPASAVTITANYADASSIHTVTYTCDGGGAKTKQAAEGDTVTITADKVSGKSFVKWIVTSGLTLSEAEAANATLTFTMPAGDVVLTAQYKEVSYKLVSKTAWSFTKEDFARMGITGKGTIKNAFEGITSNNASAKFDTSTTSVCVAANQSIALPIGADTAAVKITITLVGVNDDRYIYVGAGDNREEVWQKDVEGKLSFGEDKIYSNDQYYLKSDGMFGNTLVIAGGVGENKIASIVLEEYSEDNGSLPDIHTITVDNGRADKSAIAAGATVTVTANKPEGTNEFAGWTGEGVTFANATAETTTFVMPNADVQVTATYSTLYAITATSCTVKDADGNTLTKAPAGAQVTVTAAAAPAGKEFDQWTVTPGTVSLTETADGATFVMPAEAVTIEAVYKDEATDFALTVASGTAANAGGTAIAAGAKVTAGTKVTIKADSAPEGKVFDKWVVKAGDVTLADVKSATTTFTMPKAAVEIEATYKTGTAYAVTVTSGTASPDKAEAGSTVTITANAAPVGKTFDKWVVKSGTVTLVNERAAVTTFTMPASAVEIEAVYKEPTVVETDNASSAVTVEGSPVFEKTENGSTVEASGKIIIHAEKLIGMDGLANKILIEAKINEIINNKVSEEADKTKVEKLYYDIAAYAGSVADANKVTLKADTGKVKIKFAYPNGASRKNEIIALHNTNEVTVTKEADCFWITADGFSPYTILILPAAESAVSITRAAGYEEGAYAEWEPVAGADGYLAYVSKNASDFKESDRIDNELIRKYADHWRVDTVGLAPGTYYIKVVAATVDGTTKAITPIGEAVTSALTVTSYDRTGFAFSRDSGSKYSGSGLGAYNNDGTLKSGAQVIYVTADTAKTCKATVNGAEVVGLQSILDAKQKSGTENDILDIRIIGCVKKENLDHISSKAEGLQIKGKATYNNMNITIEGIGEDAAVHGFGFLVRNCANVEFRNFAVMAFMDDGISLDTANCNIWIHDMDLFYGSTGGDSDQAKGDGSIDVKGKSTYITISYNHFWDSGKCSLCGMSDSEEFMVTYHHNWFDHSDSRHARVRVGSIHFYNNYYDGNAKYGVGVTKGSSAFVEANYFRNCKSPMLISMQGSDIAEGLDNATFSKEPGGMIKAYNNMVVGANRLIYANAEGVQGATGPKNAVQFDAVLASTRDEAVDDFYRTVSGGTNYNNFDITYDLGVTAAQIDNPDDVPSIVTSKAGRLNGGDFTWTFTAADDTDYSVNTALKSAVVNYTSPVKAVGGINGVVSGSSGNGNGGNFEGGEGSDNSDPDHSGDDAVLGGTVHNFTTDGTASSYYHITGNMQGSPTTISYGGLTLSKALKLESPTEISFTAAGAGTLILVQTASKRTKVDGTNYTSDANGVIKIENLAAGHHEITKGDTADLYYIAFLSEGAEDPAPPADTYKVTVTGGTASPVNAKKGATVTINANDVAGKAFEKWVVKAGSVTLADETSQTTTFTMPAAAVTVEATYRTADTPVVPVDPVDPNEDFDLNVGRDLANGTYTQPVTKNGFTVLADSAYSVTVEKSSQTVSGTTYTKRLKSGGEGTDQHRSIQFTTAGAATVTVVAVSSNGSERRVMGISDGTLENGKLKDLQTQEVGTKASTYTFKLTEAGTYYVHSTSGGLNFYYIGVNYVRQGELSGRVDDEVRERAPEFKDGDLYASTKGTDTAAGSFEDPMDLLTALKSITPGHTIWMFSGTYYAYDAYEAPIIIAEDNSGTVDARKTISSINKKRVTIDFDGMEEVGSNRGITLDGSYWHFYDIDICNAGDNGMLLSGDNNIIELCQFYGNHDTGLQLSRFNTSYASKDQWPSNNLILNCTAFNNKDEATAENADGFAAKLTCGEGNVFDGCIAYCNSDDGWDLFAKTATGPIGQVTLKNCISFANGKLTNGEGSANGDMNGFKLGGSGVATAHIVENCLAFNNGATGFTDNNNPGAHSVTNCTAVNNGKYDSTKANWMCYRSASDAKYTNLVSSVTARGASTDQFKGVLSNSLYHYKDEKTNGSYYWVNTHNCGGEKEKYTGSERADHTITEADFITVTIPGYDATKNAYTADYHEIFRNPDGSVNVDGLFEVKKTSSLYTAGKDGTYIGAKFSVDGAAQTYTVSVEGGSASPVKAQAGDTVTITAKEVSGMQFKNWTVKTGTVTLADAANAETTFIMPAGLVEIVAEYEKVTVPSYDVTVEGGSATAKQAEQGKTVTITASATPGEQFIKWIVEAGGITLKDENASKTSFVMGGMAVIIKAVFGKVTYTITVENGSASQAQAIMGTEVQIVAAAAPEGKVFDSWVVKAGGVTLADETSASTSFIMGSVNVELEAVYKDASVTPVDPVTPSTPDDSDDGNGDGGEAEVIEEIDWEKVAARIDAAAKSKAPQNIDVTSGDRYEVPVKVLNKLKGKNTTLALHAGGGITLSITGTDIKKNAAAPFKVAMTHGNVIPAGAANQVLAGAAASRMFSMEDKSVYPFPVNVHVNLGAANAGKTAYMYYYDEKSNSMVLAGSFRITATGQAMFAIYRGDEYIIVVSDKPAAVKGKYIVVKGDNLTYIARKTGVTLKKLIGANPQIKNVNRIMPGQEINLP